MIKILHHGAVNGVTGSCHELRISHAGILIDCGLFQARKNPEALLPQISPSISPSTTSAPWWLPTFTSTT